MPRRSARLASSSSASTSVVHINVGPPPDTTEDNQDNDHEDSPGVESEDSDEEDVRPKKRSKHTKSKKSNTHPKLQFKNVRGRRGALKDIVEMPLDVLQEIFMYLTLVEVMYLSRMCKALRHILMTKSAECIWRQARLNLEDFPDCPDDLNEAQFANLIFGLCDYCNKAKGRYFIWSNRRHCCGPCITKRNGLIKFYDLPHELKVDLRFSQLQMILPSIGYHDKTEDSQLMPGVQRILFCEASAALLLEEYRKLDHQAQQEWVQERARERERRIAHGRQCEQWLKTQDNNRTAQLGNIRQRRYEAIKQRLTDLGWGKELETIRNMKRWPSVNQPKDLTDRIWQNIKDGLVAEMKEHRAYRLERAYSAAQCNRRNLLRDCLRDLQKQNLGKVIFPKVCVLESTESISALIKAPTEETVEFPDSLILELIQMWRQSSDIELRNMIVAGSTSISNPTAVDPLPLATTFFRCWRACEQLDFLGVLQYPEILTHGCATFMNYADEPCLWNADGNRLFFADRTYTLARAILEASGLDPETTKREDVQWPECYFECHECPTAKPQSRVLMAWSTAVWHATMHDRCNEHPRIACAADLNDTDLRRAQAHAIDQLRYSRAFMCVRCKEQHDWYRLKSHIKEKHKENQEPEPEDPVYRTDYVMNIDPYGFCSQPPRLISLATEDG